MQERYINLFTDFGFKKLFGLDVNKDLLIDLLNELIKDRGKITNITYLKNEQIGRSEWDRRAIFDIYCESDTNEKFIVEMQKSKQKYFKDRSVFYASFPIQEQAIKGNWDFKLTAVYTIGILDFVFEEDKNDTDYFHHHVQLMETKRKKVFYDKLTFIYLEMPKFNKTEDELVSHFDKWMYVLKNLSFLDARPPKLQERIFQRIFNIAEIEKLDKKEKETYEDSLKIYRDLKNVIDTSFEDGVEQGIQQGIQQGMEKGKLEGKLEAARNMLKKGINIATIAEVTGINESDIKDV